MQIRWMGGLAAAVGMAAIFACGGSSSPTSPSGGGNPAPSAGTTISIVSSSGFNAYNPNPVNVSQGSTVAWKNNDSTTHHIVMDDGSADAGTIAPGQTSAVVAVRNASGTYHCTIHPSMKGSINGAPTGDPGPNCPNGYC
jgi:plastocyanin